MDTVVERCAGLDIGKADLKACVRLPGLPGGRRQEVRRFATTTDAVLQLQQWLIELVELDVSSLREDVVDGVPEEAPFGGEVGESAAALGSDGVILARRSGIGFAPGGGDATVLLSRDNSG